MIHQPDRNPRPPPLHLGVELLVVVLCRIVSPHRVVLRSGLDLKCREPTCTPLGNPPGPRLSTNDFSLEVFLEIECTSTLARAQTSTYIFNIDIYLSDIYYIKINGHWWNLCNFKPTTRI